MNLVRVYLRDASRKYNAEIEEGVAVLEEAKEIASQASSRKPKQLKQQTKDKKEKKESSSEGSTSDSDGTDSDSDVCSQMSRLSLRCGRPPETSAPLLPFPPPYKDEGDKRGKEKATEGRMVRVPQPPAEHPSTDVTVDISPVTVTNRPCRARFLLLFLIFGLLSKLFRFSAASLRSNLLSLLKHHHSFLYFSIVLSTGIPQACPDQDPDD